MANVWSVFNNIKYVAMSDLHDLTKDRIHHESCCRISFLKQATKVALIVI